MTKLHENVKAYHVVYTGSYQCELLTEKSLASVVLRKKIVTEAICENGANRETTNILSSKTKSPMQSMFYWHYVRCCMFLALLAGNAQHRTQSYVFYVIIGEELDKIPYRAVREKATHLP